MATPAIYCDYNAGAPLRPAARAAALRAWDAGGNASSVHRFGRAAKAILEEAREALSAALDARVENVVFTSGATEAAHLAMEAARDAGCASLLMSAVEHDAIAEHGPRAFADVRVAPVTPDGVVDLDALDAVLAAAPAPALVAVMHVNNETGAIQPIEQVAALCRGHRALLLVDAAQSFGRLPVSVQALDASYVIASSHKLGGPPGAGLVALAPGAPFAAPRRGGGQERGRRPGTENVAAIAGFAAAAAEALAARAAEAERLAALRDAVEAGVLAQGGVVFAHGAPRAANVTLFAFAGRPAEAALIRLDLAGVAASSGAACSSGKVRSSRVLTAMGVDPALAGCAVRISFGWDSRAEDPERILTALAQGQRAATPNVERADA